MRRAIAKRHEPSYICPLCQYLDKTELGIENHRKRFALFVMAYDRGHSSGYQEIWFYMEELSELRR